MEDGLAERVGVRVSETASSGRGADFQAIVNHFRVAWVVGYTDAYVGVSKSVIDIMFVPKTRHRLDVSI